MSKNWNLEKFNSDLVQMSKSEKDLVKDFIFEAKGSKPVKQQPVQQVIQYVQPTMASGVMTNGLEAKAKDLKIDQIVQITQQLNDGTVRRYKFKIIERWPTPTNFFTVVSLEKPKDELNLWILFYNNTWYIKKGNKSLLNVRVTLV